MRRRAVVGMLLFLWGCASGAGFYRAGQQAQSGGQLEDARTAYESALEIEPNNAQFRRAYDQVTRELMQEVEARATAGEQQRDWLSASSAWSKASELDPKNEDYQVRRDLSLLKSQNLDPDAWFRGVAEVSKRHPSHEIVTRTLDKARKQAYLFRVGLAKREIGLRHHRKAVEQLDEAVKIDPEHPGLSQSDLDRAKALAIVEEGDIALAADNPVAAVDHYEAAYRMRPSASIKRKLDRTRARSRELIGTLEAARKSAASGNYANAIKLYAKLVRMQGAPPEAVRELATLEQKIIKDIAAAAQGAVERNDLRAAHQFLLRGLDQVKADRETRDQAKAGLARIERGEPGSGVEAIEKARLPSPDSEPLTAAINAYATAVAKKRIGDAERLARKDPAAAARLLEELDPFRATLPEVEQLERSLKVGSFTIEVERATDAAKRGDDRTAAEQLMKALAISQAPPEIRDPIRAACGQLAKQQFVESERTFLSVQERAPRSRLAIAGVMIARLRREANEQQALTALAKGDGQESRAVAILEASVGLQPESASLAKGRDLLLAQIGPSVSDRRAAELIEMASRLSALAPVARAALSEGAKHLGSGDYQNSERAFALALERSPEAKVASAGLEVTAARRSVELERAESAKRNVSAALDKKVAEADAKAAQKDWAGALARYDSLAREPGMSAAALEGKIAAAEAGLIADLLDRADRASQRSQADESRRALREALDRLRAPDAAKAKMKTALDRMTAEPGEGLELARASGVTSEPLLASVERFAEMSAQLALEEAKRNAEKDPARTAEILRDLQPFEAKLSGIGELRKKVKVDAFTAKLERAQLAAEAENRGEAARVLREALKESKAPAALEKSVLAGCSAIEAEKWIDAERAFLAALEASPESRIADYGLDVVRVFRRRVDAEALEVIRKDRDGVDEAVASLAASREVAPDDPVRTEAVKVLVAKLKRSKRLSNPEAAAVIARVARLDGADEVLRGAELLKTGDHPGAAAAFNRALSQNPRLEIARLGLERSQASLTDGVARGDVAIEDESTALVLRGLLEKRRDDEDLQGALTKLVERIKLASEPATAARYLGLAAIASGMKGTLRQAVDAGQVALAKGEFAEAEGTLGKAVEIDPASEIARAGFEAAKFARKADLVRRVVVEHEAGRADRVKNALAKKLDEGGSVLEVMLAEAARLASLGRDVDAAHILDAANAITEGPAQAAVKRANALLAGSRHKEAEKAYAEHSEASEVAEAGEKIAFTRHIQKLLEGVHALGRLEDPENSAKSAAEIFAIDPRDSDVKKALAKVYDRAEETAGSDNAEMLRMLTIAASVIGRTDELNPALTTIRGGKHADASELLRKLGAEFEQESEDEETSEREPVVEYCKRARAALGKL